MTDVEWKSWRAAWAGATGPLPDVRARALREVRLHRLASVVFFVLVAIATDGVIRLLPGDTKAEDARTVLLTERVLEALKALPSGLPGVPVLPNPSTGAPWQDIRKAFRRAVAKAKLEGLWFHDLRRSFVTRARKLGVSEFVVMRMSAHRTRAVFDRYNVVDEKDLREAVRILEKFGRGLDTMGVSANDKPQSHTE